MDDKDKFLSEWQKNFPKEEPPDISFFSSINSLNIRRKISECEERIQDLQLAIKKEEFILNWLITVDIEISVLGNVGMSTDVVENTRPSHVDDAGDSLDGNIERGINDDEQEHHIEKMDNVILNSEDLEYDGITRDETTQDIQHESNDLNEGEIVTFSQNNENKQELHFESDSSSSSAQLNSKQMNVDFKRSIDKELKFGEELGSPDNHEYVNVFELMSGHENKEIVEEETEEHNNKSKVKRRAGGSWSVYMEEEREQIPNLNQEINRNIVEQKDSPIYEEIRLFDAEKTKNTQPQSDNVTLNVLYESTDIIKPFSENQVDQNEENIYENVQQLNFPSKNILIPSGIRLDGNDSASDYDSDGGRNDYKGRKEITNFRNMTVDEIDNLRKWASDEDLSQTSHDLDEKSGDSDDSLEPAMNEKIEIENKREEIKHSESKELDSLQSGKKVDIESSDEVEEDGETNMKSQKMRLYLVKNLLESEKCYFDCLDMVQKYMKPLQKSTETSQPILTIMEFDKIFLGISGLYVLHKDLLQQLKKRILNWDENQVIGDLLKILMDGFSVYKDYINNYKSSQETLLKCRNANAILDNILQKDIKISSLKDPIKLDALLYKPIDRMTQYSLILNDLLKNTPEDHPDNELLSEATANLFDLFEQVNVNRRDKKAPQRQLLKEGNVVELVEGERKMRTLILMTDVIICAKLKSPKDAYVCKWYLPLVDIQLKPFKESESAQTVPVTTKAECDRLRATIANIRSEMRKDSLVLTSSVSTDSSGSPFVRPKLRKRDSTTQPSGARASTRGMDKLRKKLNEQERLLQLIAPSFPFNLYHKSGKTYTLLLSSDDDKILWKEAIHPRIKRMISRKQESVHLSSAEIQQALDISYRIHRLGMRFGAIIPSPYSSAERDDSKNIDDEGLTGFLYVHIQNGKSFSKTVEFYCVMEVDSYGYFFRKAKTKPSKGSEPHWDEDFEFDVEAASSLRISCYSSRSRLLGDELSGKVTIDLIKENLTDNMSHTFSVILDKQGAVTLTISYSSTLQGIERTRTNACCTNVFKAQISQVTRREKFDIPLVVISCIKEIEKRGLEEVGIYRLSGVASEVKSLKEAFDENPQTAVFALSEADIHAVAGLIKLYLRELPEPLFTNSRYPRFVSGLQISDPEEKELYMTDLLQQLPKPNKLTTLYLLEHLRRVSQFEKINKMGVNNLSTVFGPTVLRPSISDNDQTAENFRSGSTFDIGALDVMSQVSIFRYFIGLQSTKTRLPNDDLELWQRLDHEKAADIQKRLMENAVEYLI